VCASSPSAASWPPRSSTTRYRGKSVLSPSPCPSSDGAVTPGPQSGKIRHRYVNRGTGAGPPLPIIGLRAPFRMALSCSFRAKGFLSFFLPSNRVWAVAPIEDMVSRPLVAFPPGDKFPLALRESSILVAQAIRVIAMPSTMNLCGAPSRW